MCRQAMSLPEDTAVANCSRCGATGRWFACGNCKRVVNVWGKDDSSIWEFSCPHCRQSNRLQLAPSPIVPPAPGDVLPTAPQRPRSRVGAIKKDLMYRFAGPTPSDPAKQLALTMAVYEQVTLWFQIPMDIRPARYPGLGLGGKGLGLGTLTCGDSSWLGDWYADDEALYFYAPPLEPGYPFTYDVVPQIMTGNQTLRLLDWERVTGIVIDGQEATSSTSTVTGKHRDAFHVLGTAVNETMTTEAAAHASVVFECETGPDMMLDLLMASPKVVRQELSGALAIVRRRSQQGEQSPAAPVSVADELAKLADLMRQGFLTEAEFQSQKARLLGI